jgi:hypothetical protein
MMIRNVLVAASIAILLISYCYAGKDLNVYRRDQKVVYTDALLYLDGHT